MKINLKKYIGIFVSCSQFMQMAMPLKVYSKTVKIAEEEQHNKQKINSKIDSLNRESKIQNEEQKHVEKQISDALTKINNLEKERDKLKKQNTSDDESIDKSVSEMENLKKKVNEIDVNVENLKNDSEDLEKDLRYIVLDSYTNNSNNFNNNISLLINANNITDFAKSVEYTKKCTDYGNDVIASYSNNIKELETQKNLKVQQYNDLSKKVQDIDKKINESNVIISRLSSLNETLSKDVEKLQKVLDETKLRSKFIEENKKKCEAMKKKLEEEKEDPTMAITQIINNKKDKVEQIKDKKEENLEKKENKEDKKDKIEDIKSKEKEGKLNKNEIKNKKDKQKKEDNDKGQKANQTWINPLKGSKYKYERGFVAGGHKGIDWSTGGKKIPVHPAKNGTVIHIGNNKTKGFRGYGNHVLIDNGDGYTSLYAHLDDIIIKVGQRLTTKDVIGKTGQSGNAKGIHLHYEIRYKGKPVNPAKYIKS